MNRTNWNGDWLFSANDDDWQAVTLPHDAMIHGKRDPNAPSGCAQGFFAGGRYVYEKRFLCTAEEAAQHTVFEFEGVYKNANVFLNGQKAGGAPYGYIPFLVCADGLLQEGENTLQVECDNADQPDSRWYSGAGIYRPVWRWSGPRGGIAPQGVRVTATSIDPPAVRVEVNTEGAAPDNADYIVEILDGGQLIAEAEGMPCEIALPGAALWSEDSPKLYTCYVTQTVDGKPFDTAQTIFGIRQITWDNKGLYINGKSTLLRGGCLHHDSGILGAATYDEAEYRRVKRLKDAGFNAIRSAHNPASRSLLDACDALGVYVMDESWDMWYNHKNKYDYAGQWRANYRADLQAMAARDYNHPSVVMYSIGNEVSEPAQAEGVAKAREMVALLHKLDSTRPVTAGFNLMIVSNAKKGKGVYKEDGGMADDKSAKMQGMNSTMFNLIASMVGTGMNKAANGKKADAATTPTLDALDISGYNYASGRYAKEGQLHPNRLIFGSETFPQDIVKNWAMVEKYPYLIGDFMWTAWDYLGEAGLGAWAYTKDGAGFNKPYPWLLADVGVFDILGNENAELYWAQAAWGQLRAPAIAVQPLNHDHTPSKMVWRGSNALPSWSWQGCEGKKAVVEVYAAAPAARITLYLNGKQVDQKPVKECRALFKVTYAPGTLEAAALDAAGRELGRSRLRTATGQIQIAARPEQPSVRPGGIAYIPITLEGTDGVVESNADRTLTVHVEGGTLLAFGSANPRTEERFDSGVYTTYYGRALAVVQAGQSGAVKLTIQDDQQNECGIIAITE